MALKWREIFSVGIGKIDERNRELFQRTDALQNAIDTGKEALIPHSYFKFLDEYATSHFSYEEQLLTQHGYPHVEFHRNEHDKFRKDLEKLKTRIATEGFTPQNQQLTCRILNHWLAQHICITDRALADLQRGNGKRVIPVMSMRLPIVPPAPPRHVEPPLNLGDPFFVEDNPLGI